VSAGREAQTPGQAMWEHLAAAGLFPMAQHWQHKPQAVRDEYEAAAQAALDAYGVLAAVKAADGDTIVIAFSRPLDQRTASEIRERWAAHAPGVTLAIVDNVAAIKGRQP